MKVFQDWASGQALCGFYRKGKSKEGQADLGLANLNTFSRLIRTIKNCLLPGPGMIIVSYENQEFEHLIREVDLTGFSRKEAGL